MFTGIVEEIGKVENIQKSSRSMILTIKAEKMTKDLKIGDSVAVNGVCLTITSFNQRCFMVDVMPETLNRSSLKELKKGSQVNLERAMMANDRFDGHIVSGHIDGIGTIVNIKTEDNATWYTIKTSKKIGNYIVEKGSVAIDGISLTVANIVEDTFSVSIIPHTWKATILQKKQVGDTLNIENDCIGKYVEKLMLKKTETGDQKKKMTHTFLLENGF